MNLAPPEIRDLLERARTEGLQVVETSTDTASLEEARVRAMGRKSALSQARSGLRGVPDDQRKELGQLATEVQRELEAAIAAKQEVFDAAERAARWERERIDVTLPGDEPPVGATHPITRIIDRLVDIFIGLGYRVADGPEVELSTYNFDALNIPPEHPSRSPSDTYYIEGRGLDVCLRPHTSPVQMRTLQEQQPPIYVVVPGRCYRRDELDATHLNTFSQIEGLAVDVGITMADLKGTLEVFAREMFGRDLEVRLRPSFFPFTEPSAEMDVQCFACKGRGCRVCKNEGWIETLGCGLVHPYLLEWAGHDSEKYSGFAFGMGLERIAALVYGVTDIRFFYENDLRFLAPFRGLS